MAKPHKVMSPATSTGWRGRSTPRKAPVLMPILRGFRIRRVARPHEAGSRSDKMPHTAVSTTRRNPTSGNQERLPDLWGPGGCSSVLTEHLVPSAPSQKWPGHLATLRSGAEKYWLGFSSSPLRVLCVSNLSFLRHSLTISPPVLTLSGKVRTLPRSARRPVSPAFGTRPIAWCR